MNRSIKRISMLYCFKKFCLLAFYFLVASASYGQISITTEPSLPGSGVGTGSVHVVADGTAGPFQLVLTAPIDFAVADNIQGSFTYRNVPAGMHRLRVTDRYDCQTWYDVIVEEEACDLEIILLSLTAPELCETVTGEGCDEGAITVTSSVDPSQITFTWTAQTYIGEQVYSGPELSGLYAGTYTVTAWLGNSGECTATRTFTIDACTLRIGTLSTFTNVDAQTVIITSDQVIAPSGISCDGQILVSFDNDHNNQNSYSWRKASDDTHIASPDGKDLRVNVCGGETYILSVTNGCTEEEYTFEVPTCDEHFVADMNAALSITSNVHSSDLRPDFIRIEAYIISDASQFEVIFDDYLGQPLPTKRLFNNGGNVYTFTLPAFIEGGQGGPLLPEIPVRGLLPYRIVNSNGCSFSGLVEIPDCSDRFIWTNRGGHEFIDLFEQECNDDHTIVLPDFQGSEGPFFLHMELVDARGSISTWDRSIEYPELPNGEMVKNLPSGIIMVTFEDACGPIEGNYIFVTCDGIGCSAFDVVEIGEGDDQVFEIASSIRFEVEGSCFGGSSKLTLEVQNLPLNGDKFQVTWPNSETTIIDAHPDGLRIEGNEDWEPDSHGQYAVAIRKFSSITNEFDQCATGFEVEFEDPTTIIDIREWIVTEFGDPFSSNTSNNFTAITGVKYCRKECGECVSSDNRRYESTWGSYVTSPLQTPVAFTPFNENNYCTGGILLISARRLASEDPEYIEIRLQAADLVDCIFVRKDFIYENGERTNRGCDNFNAVFSVDRLPFANLPANRLSVNFCVPNGVIDVQDSDGDNVPDDIDNCINRENRDQVDSDGDGIGDACDTHDGPNDSDGDNVTDDIDNCRFVPNGNQEDCDNDGEGDVCDFDYVPWLDCEEQQESDDEPICDCPNLDEYRCDDGVCTEICSDASCPVGQRCFDGRCGDDLCQVLVLGEGDQGRVFYDHRMIRNESFVFRYCAAQASDQFIVRQRDRILFDSGCENQPNGCSCGEDEEQSPSCEFQGYLIKRIYLKEDDSRISIEVKGNCMNNSDLIGLSKWGYFIESCDRNKSLKSIDISSISD